jgi:hypothetical protein
VFQADKAIDLPRFARYDKRSKILQFVKRAEPMFRLILRGLLSGMLTIAVPAQMLAGDSASAMLYANGQTWINGSEVPKSAALFNGDLVQTRSDATASLNAKGSSVMVLADSLVRYEGPAVEIEHGAVRIATSQGLATRAGDVTVKPARDSWTEFQVVDVDGRVQIAANKGDLTIQDDQGSTTTLQQGQQTTRDDTTNPEKKKKRKRRGAGAATAAGGGLMSSPYVLYPAIGIAGGLTAWAILQHDEPVSPACRTNPCK